MFRAEGAEAQEDRQRDLLGVGVKEEAEHMKKTEARKILKESIRGLRSAMSLQSWQINIEWRDMEAGNLATCRTDARYRLADIEVDHSQHEDRAHLLSTLRHELMHIFHAEFKLFELGTSHLISKPARDSLGEVYNAAQEKTVAAIEAMLEQGLGLTPEKMIALTKRWNR